ncbi:MAG: hypothetical protein HRT53_17565 [Colwellia sp.]|nr:hypothetical protein [Colwellia sp.]
MKFHASRQSNEHSQLAAIRLATHFSQLLLSRLLWRWHLKFCLSTITAVYLIRGVGGIVVAFMPNSVQVQQPGVSFLLWSSFICTIYGVSYSVGVLKGWSSFSPKHI